MQNRDYDPKAKTYKMSMPKEDIPIQHNIHVWPSWQDLQKFIYQTNRRFLLLWLALVACLAVSAIAILVAILG